MFSNSKDSLCHQLGHEEHLLKSCFSFIDLSEPLHPFFLHKPGHDQCFLVWRTGSDWTAKLKQAEVLCCQKNHSEMKCCCHGLCDVWHVLLANPLWLQGLDAVHYMFRHTPSATQQHNYDVLYNSAGMSWSSSGAIKLSGSSGTDETACRFDLLWITVGYVFCVLGRASSVAGSAPPWSCRFPRLQHQRAKSCLKSTKGVGLKLSRSSAGWPHMWLIESKPCIILSSWWRSGVLTQLIHWKCFCLPAWPSRRPSSPRCLLSSPAGSSSSLWMCVVGVTIAAYQRLVWHAAPPTSLRCLRAYITMATGDDC